MASKNITEKQKLLESASKLAKIIKSAKEVKKT